MRRRFEKILAAPPSWLTPILYPLSLLYSMGAAAHRGLYRMRALKASALPKPVVSVGNLTVGGGGKTPVVIWLAEALAQMGLKPAILSRGYGSRSGGVRIVDQESEWRDFGDEPFMMAGRLEHIPIGVSKNRYLSGCRVLDDYEVDLFILDDGYQHHALHRDLDIVVIDGLRRFGNGRQLPAGILREPLARLDGADYLIVTRSKRPDPDFQDYLMRYSAARVLWANYRMTGLKKIGPERNSSTSEVPAGTVVAFCAIAGPEGFRLTLEEAGEEAGFTVAELLSFPDHHVYGSSDIDLIMKAADRHNATALVTTEKDAVRWPHEMVSLPVYSLAVMPEINDTGDLVKDIMDLVRESVG